jgi:anaerobic selenocysteine-containing dehydrogenase
LGYQEFFPWATIEDAIDEELKPSGFKVSDLKGKSAVWCPTPLKYRKYEEAGFRTPSNKFEFYSPTLKAYGYDPLPSYQEPPESPVSNPKLAERFPLILTTGNKNIYRTHSQCLSISVLREHFPDPVAEINPKDAEERGIQDGDWVTVRSPRGQIIVKAMVTDKVHEGTAEVEHGWGGQSNVNLLTSMESVDPVSGYPGLRECLCEITRYTKKYSYPKDQP